MTLDDLRCLLLTAPGETELVHVFEFVEFPGYVCDVYLTVDGSVRVECNISRLDEGGACFCGAYDDLAQAVTALETFVEIPLAQWNFGNVKLREAHVDPSRETHAALGRMIAESRLPLPRGSTFTLSDSYWSRFERK